MSKISTPSIKTNTETTAYHKPSLNTDLIPRNSKKLIKTK